MAITFNKKSWKSRISEHPTRRRLTIVDASLGYSLVDVARDEGTVEQVGDTFDKSTMDDLENRIENIAITAQAECDGLQEQIDDLPSLDDVKAVDIGWKESGTRNVAGDTIRVNPFELFSGTVGTGKNLTYPNYQGRTDNGVDFTVNSDNSITCYGVATANAYSTPNLSSDESKMLKVPAGTYTLSGAIRDKARVYLGGKYIDGSSLPFNTDTGSGKTFTLTQEAWIYPTVLVLSGVNADFTIYIQLEVGETVTTYEPFVKKINGFIPSAKFFQMGRAFMQEKPAMNISEELEPYYKGATLTVTQDRFISYEKVDNERVSDIQTMYGYDYEQEQFLASVAGEIYTATGSISCDLRVTDIWGCGGNGAGQYHSDTTVPVELNNRNTTSANGFPIELMPLEQSDVASLVVGSPVSFRITGELYILLHNGTSLDEYVEGMHVSKFYKFVPWNDTRDGVHYAKHYIDIEKGTTFNLSSITTLINYHFLQAYVDDPDMLDYISWTVTDSNIAITGDDFASNIILHIDQRKDGETEPDYDTAEDIIINVI